MRLDSIHTRFELPLGLLMTEAQWMDKWLQTAREKEYFKLNGYIVSFESWATTRRTLIVYREDDARSLYEVAGMEGDMLYRNYLTLFEHPDAPLEKQLKRRIKNTISKYVTIPQMDATGK